MTIKSDHRELMSHWQQYRLSVLTEIRTPEAIVELRRCFFAGAHSLMFEILKCRELPREEAEPRLRLLDTELAAFAELAREGLDRDPDKLELREQKKPAKGKIKRKPQREEGKP